MQRTIRFLLPVGLALGVFVTPAFAATTDAQLVALSREGLSDDILVALIQTDGSYFELSADDILKLHRAGLSDVVIRAMQATSKPQPKVDVMTPQPQPDVQPDPPVRPAPLAPAAEGPVIISSLASPAPWAPNPPAVQVYAVPVFVPVYVHVTQPVAPVPPPPVYWGWGGHRRPDSWDDGLSSPAKATTAVNASTGSGPAAAGK